MRGKEIKKYASRMDDVLPVLVKNFQVPRLPKLYGTEVTLPQYFALTTITRKGKCMVGELSKLLGVSVNTVSELVGRLVKKRFVKKEKDEKDRRRVHIHLTQLGKKIIRKVDYWKKRHIKGILRNLTEDDCRVLIQIMEKMTGTPQELGEARRL
ncbi:MAG: MarR family winged helix-turn-helix transcriptional regulator [bacterium]